MNITIVCDVLGEPNNGTSLAAYNLINSLTKKGHNVKVICPDEDKKDLPNYYVTKTLDLGKFINGILDRNHVSLSSFDSKLIEAACKDADVVHGIVPFALSNQALNYCLENKIPFSCGFHMQAENISAHLFTMGNRFVNNKIYKFFFRKFFNKVQAIHFPTEFIKNYVTKYDVNRDKHGEYVISNGVNKEFFYPNPNYQKDSVFSDKFVIIMSGRLCAEKHQIDLIRAVKRSKHQKDIQILFTGDGPDKAKLVKKGRKLSNPPIFKQFKHETLNMALWQGDLYVHTSIVDIEAISCLEGFACGLVPIISYSKKSATSKFALDDRSKYKSGNVCELAKKIDYWFEHPEEKAVMSKEYAEYSKQFDFNKCMDQMEQMLIETSKFYEGK